MGTVTRPHPLEVMLPMGVADVLARWEQDPSLREYPDDMIDCLECGGRRNGCSVCGDHGSLTRRDAYAGYVLYHADDLLLPSKKEGQTARVFNVACTLRAMAMMPQVHREDRVKWYCPICYSRQYTTPSGSTCKNGHGGVDGVRLYPRIRKVMDNG